MASTYHVQDFKDVEGDRLIGRRTLPIVAPQHARKTVISGLVAWSVALALIWELDVLASAVLLLLGAVVGGRFLLYRSVRADQVSFYLYNVRLPPVTPSTLVLIRLIRCGCHSHSLFQHIGDLLPSNLLVILMLSVLCRAATNIMHRLSRYPSLDTSQVSLVAPMTAVMS